MNPIKLSIKEIFNSKSFSMIFILNLSLGLLGFVCLNSFNESMKNSLSLRAKRLLAADIAVGGRKNLNKEQKEKIETLLLGKVQAKAEVIELYSMGKAIGGNGKSRLMQIKAVTESFPLYGEIGFQSGASFKGAQIEKLVKEKNVWVSEDLVQQLKIKVGESIKLGQIFFKVTQIIKEDSSASWRGVGLAPKLYIGHDWLKKTGLLSFGSIANYSYLYQLKKDFYHKEDLYKIKSSLEKVITDPAIKINLPENASEQVGRVLNYLSDYLGLVALVALFLSGIGTAYLFQSFLVSRIKEIGILKSLGLSGAKIRMIYIVQILILGAISVLLANSFALMLFTQAQKLITDKLGMSMELIYSLKTFGISLLVAFGASLFICLPILIKILRKRTKDILFGQVNLSWMKKDFFLFTPLIFLFYSLSIWQAQSFLIGTIFFFSIIVSIFLFLILLPLILGFFDQRLLKRRSRLSGLISLPFGLGLRLMLRNRFETTMSFLSLSLGVMLLLFIGQLEQSLQTELGGKNVNRPSLFLFDIQEEQISSLKKISEELSLPSLPLSPMVRARITHINDKKFKRKQKEKIQTREAQRKRFLQNRGINLSYELQENKNYKVIKGKKILSSFDEKKQKYPYLSLEERYAKRMGLKIGDVLTFDILGIEVKGEVINLRKVKWTSFWPNFFIVFQRGVLEDAPKSYISAVGKISDENKATFQDLVVERLHNISILNVSEVLSKVLQIFASMALAIKIMAMLCLLVGLVVIFSITQHQVRRLSKEISVQKVLGMKFTQQLSMVNWFFGVVSILAIFLGGTASITLGFGLSSLFFDGIWQLDWKFLLLVSLGILFLTTFTVSVACTQMLRKKVATFLR